jgi:hypothetical protein
MASLVGGATIEKELSMNSTYAGAIARGNRISLPRAYLTFTS